MNQSTTTNPASPRALQPWHPETLWDIRNLELSDLPGETPGFDPSPRASELRISGSPRFVREQMEDIFLRNPAVSFALHDGSVQVYRPN